MALTGDLEHLHIADIIQLIHSTRQSGTFAVKGARGASRLIFSNGYIVGANHLDNSVRIGAVLVKMKLISLNDLSKAHEIQQQAGKERKPLIATLRQMGVLKQEDAMKALRKLVEITVVELIGWPRGIFTFDSEAISVSSECAYDPGSMDQELNLDAQMVLMDAMRVYDERERDRDGGKQVLSYEEYFSDPLPGIGMEEPFAEPAAGAAEITADDLGLADLDKLEKRIPLPSITLEAFDPAAIQRRKVRESLPGFPEDAVRKLIEFLEKAGSLSPEAAGRGAKREARAMILVTTDELLIYSCLTVFRNRGILVFQASNPQDEIIKIREQCARVKALPFIALDSAAMPKTPAADTAALAGLLRRTSPDIPILHLGLTQDARASIALFGAGVTAILPRPQSGVEQSAFVDEFVLFLEALGNYVAGYPCSAVSEGPEEILSELRARIAEIRALEDINDILKVLVRAASGAFGRAIGFRIKEGLLAGVWASGISEGKESEPVSAAHISIPTDSYSVCSDTKDTGLSFSGEIDDDILNEHLFSRIGAPVMPWAALYPLKSRGITIAMIYADFGRDETKDVPGSMFEILVSEAGLLLDNSLYRRQILEAARNR